ncbi:MFS transporter [Cryptosporangium aurantiacum]|uniref:Major Facilitator Superfamily protein n=1 Tax=Cryptosporangium aurantiacum TaxID=134849 RepID=A0A1M7RLP7_9ACTN|nr:MFS transporter [Cryptosporangium aurantiacum]SHN47109.1 Major Facilitator Superfamily protein [Cryptosporangium aurantiacum]
MEYTLVSDFHGRQYRVGENSTELIGRSRAWMLRAPWAAMAAAGLLQYGIAATLPALARTNGWSSTETLCVLGVWVACQAGVAVPATWLYRRGAPRRLLAFAAVLCGIGLATPAHTGNVAGVLLGYSVLGGLGAGLVYVVCIGVATEWFPERIASVTGAVSGAFGYGAVPFVLVASGVDARPVVFDVAAVLVFGAVVSAALVVRRPPEHWWPAQLDPRLWALDRRLNRSIPNNAPAIRAHGPADALRSGMLPLMWALVGILAAMALFDLAYLGTSGSGVAVPVAVLAFATGLARVVTGRLSDRVGRRRMLMAALLLGGLAQFGLLAGVSGDRPVAVLLSAAVAGAGTGAGYSLLVGLVRDWFGDEATLPNYGLVYTGKAVGGVAGLLLVAAPGNHVAFAVAGLLGIGGALAATVLRRPGRPGLPLPGR